MSTRDFVKSLSDQVEPSLSLMTVRISQDYVNLADELANRASLVSN